MRRFYLIHFTALFLIINSACTPTSREETQQKPNILFAFADDWGKYASCYANVKGSEDWQKLVKTPHIDRIANEGVLFNRAYVNAPSCTPCRSSLLSGQYFYRTGRGAILQGAVWDETIPTYPLLLEQNGYHIGYTYKVWSPGKPVNAGYGGERTKYETAGRSFNQFSQNVTKMVTEGKTIAAAKQVLLDEVRGNFQAFLNANENGQPFCYWFGPTNTHRKWTMGSGKKLWGIEPDNLTGKLPPFLPDVDTVREDFADYLGETMAFDAGLGVLLEMLEERGELDNTLIVVSGDHGIPGFPHGKCNLYDFGTSVGLMARWPGVIKPKRVVDDFVNLMDLAPTFLEVGGAVIPELMTGKSLLDVFRNNNSGQIEKERNYVITGRERHVAKAREDNLPYPQRAIRTDDFLYIINFQEDRFPMGDPGEKDETELDFDLLANNTFATYADLDASPTKAWIVKNRNNGNEKFYQFAFGKRPSEELYAIAGDPFQIKNLADDPSYENIKTQLREQLLKELKATGDPRVTGDGQTFERMPYITTDF
ncbi:sulfatase [Prolixibacteraceae bacterium Z1-6]|uniref:Sulfatase n=1 Tax=Draconibacterium aestuarii TaxID=2998507 RepID=A0A9X3FEC3_9BACT|nr:sulfatase [Prolixibacteraceae bacterium Z1-6]